MVGWAAGLLQILWIKLLPQFSNNTYTILQAHWIRYEDVPGIFLEVPESSLP